MSQGHTPSPARVHTSSEPSSSVCPLGCQLGCRAPNQSTSAESAPASIIDAVADATERPSSDWGEVPAVLHEATSVRQQLHSPDPAEGSPASTDLEDATTAFGSNEVVARCIRMADLWTLIAVDHLGAMGTLLDSWAGVFPLFPLARSAIEHAAWTCWVLDPTAETKERCIRAALAEVRSAEEMLKVANRWGGKQHEVYRRALQERDRVVRSVEETFSEYDPVSKTIAGQASARPSEVVEHLGTTPENKKEWLGIYDHLCATANHPSLSAFEFFDFEDGRTFESVTPDYVERLLRSAVSPVVRSLEHLARYMGWNRDPLNTYVDLVNSTLGDQG